MRTYQKYFVFFLCLSIFLGGCGQGTIPDRNRTYIYYVNGDGTGLVKEEYEDFYDFPCQVFQVYIPLH